MLSLSLRAAKRFRNWRGVSVAIGQLGGTSTWSARSDESSFREWLGGNGLSFW